MTSAIVGNIQGNTSSALNQSESFSTASKTPQERMHVLSAQHLGLDNSYPMKSASRPDDYARSDALIFEAMAREHNMLLQKIIHLNKDRHYAKVSIEKIVSQEKSLLELKANLPAGNTQDAARADLALKALHEMKESAKSQYARLQNEFFSVCEAITENTDKVERFKKLIADAHARASNPSRHFNQGLRI